MNALGGVRIRRPLNLRTSEDVKLEEHKAGEVLNETISTQATTSDGSPGFKRSISPGGPIDLEVQIVSRP